MGNKFKFIHGEKLRKSEACPEFENVDFDFLNEAVKNINHICGDYVTVISGIRTWKVIQPIDAHIYVEKFDLNRDNQAHIISILGNGLPSDSLVNKNFRVCFEFIHEPGRNGIYSISGYDLAYGIFELHCVELLKNIEHALMLDRSRYFKDTKVCVKEKGVFVLWPIINLKNLQYNKINNLM